MPESKTESRSVFVQFSVVPDQVKTDEDLTNLGRFVIEIARDEMLREDDPEAYYAQQEGLILAMKEPPGTATSRRSTRPSY